MASEPRSLFDWPAAIEATMRATNITKAQHGARTLADSQTKLKAAVGELQLANAGLRKAEELAETKSAEIATMAALHKKELEAKTLEFDKVVNELKSSKRDLERQLDRLPNDVRDRIRR